MKLSTVICSALLTLFPLNVMAQQENYRGYPQWARGQRKPEYVHIYQDSYFSYAVDKNYVPLSNGDYGVTLYILGNGYDPVYFSIKFYEFNCKTTKYIHQGSLTGELIQQKVEKIDWYSSCKTNTCQGLNRIRDYLIPGIKKYCPF